MDINNNTGLLVSSNNNGEYSNNIWSMKGKLEFVDEWFLMGSPVHVTSIILIYLIFVLKIGPAVMMYRRPFELRRFLIAYNFIQIIASILIFILGLRVILPNGLILRKCILSNESSKMIAHGIYYYFICKLIELIDTVLFVLRKKQNQVSFLHVYHHSIMVLTSWSTLKLEPTYTTVFLGTVNSFVHIVMYTYYALSSFPEMSKYLWWKRYITVMQLVQFVLVLLQAMATYIISDCKPSYILGAVIMFNAVLFMYLFGDFYFKAYNNRNNDDSCKKENSSSEKPFKNGKIENGFSTVTYRNGVKGLH